MRAYHLSAIADSMRRMISADPELIESLAILSDTAGELIAEQRAEAEWEWQQMHESGADRCPPRE